jgi:hypothetical protein
VKGLRSGTHQLHEASSNSNSKTIFLDLDKYKVVATTKKLLIFISIPNFGLFFVLKIKLNEKKATIKELAISTNATNASNSTQPNRIMVNVPLAPKKYHTFNENDKQSTATSNSNSGGANGPSNGHSIENGSHSNEKDNQEIFDNFAKPVLRTGSNINTVRFTLASFLVNKKTIFFIRIRSNFVSIHSSLKMKNFQNFRDRKKFKFFYSQDLVIFKISSILKHYFCISDVIKWVTHFQEWDHHIVVFV